MVTSYSAGNCKKFYNFAYKFLLNILPIEISEKELHHQVVYRRRSYNKTKK